MTRYRGRFAPSPTGPLHFGSLVAAVASFLEARTRGGAWLVRIEDLDPPRMVPDAADGILRALEACGMQWDESVVRQSTRGDAYHAALHQLRRSGLLYPCACSRREIADSALAGIEGPAELARADVKTLWQWALENWRLANVPQVAARKAEG